VESAKQKRIKLACSTAISENATGHASKVRRAANGIPKLPDSEGKVARNRLPVGAQPAFSENRISSNWPRCHWRRGVFMTKSKVKIDPRFLYLARGRVEALLAEERFLASVLADLLAQQDRIKIRLKSLNREIRETQREIANARRTETD
jgi:hypothetical protein